MKRRHLLIGAGALTSLCFTNIWQKPIMAQSNRENSTAVAQNIETVLREVIESSEANSITSKKVGSFFQTLRFIESVG